MSKEESKGRQPLVEHVDYYMENGLLVFTEAYHKKRGYCCGSGCRHCPYRAGSRPTTNSSDNSKEPAS